MEPTGPGHATCAPASVAIDHTVDLMSQQEMCHEAVSERTFELPCTFPTVGPAITKPPDRLEPYRSTGGLLPNPRWNPSLDKSLAPRVTPLPDGSHHRDRAAAHRPLAVSPFKCVLVYSLKRAPPNPLGSLRSLLVRAADEKYGPPSDPTSLLVPCFFLESPSAHNEKSSSFTSRALLIACVSCALSGEFRRVDSQQNGRSEDKTIEAGFGERWPTSKAASVRRGRRRRG